VKHLNCKLYYQQLHLKSQYYKMFKTLQLSYLQQNVLKSFGCYNSHTVSLCAGCIYSLYYRLQRL